MCECGCGCNHKRYKFPAPNGAFYLLTLASACTNCCAPSGVDIELVEPGTFNFKYYSEREYHNGDLRFSKWPDSKGVAIVTGMDKGDFVNAAKSYLIGIDSKDFGENGIIDEIGAETIIEEMYDDLQMRPAIVEPVVEAK